MSEELSDKFILSLLDEKPAKKLIRTQTQYPSFPEGGPIKWHDTFSPNKSLRCASRGCSTPTCYTFRGIPYCSLHLITLLNLELMTGRDNERCTTASTNRLNRYTEEDGGRNNDNSDRGTKVLNL